MTTITSGAGYATLINVFTVEPSKSRELVALLTAVTDTVMQDVPGFISANIHLSTDGERVVNYAQWESGRLRGDAGRPDGARAHVSGGRPRHQLRSAPVHRRVGARPRLTAPVTAHSPHAWPPCGSCR